MQVTTKPGNGSKISWDDAPTMQYPSGFSFNPFYFGIHDKHRSTINAVCGGDMSSKTEEELLTLFKTDRLKLLFME